MFVPSSHFSANCTILPPVSTSDHNSIILSLPFTQYPPSYLPLCRVWLYDKANFPQANGIINSIPWDHILSESDTESSWLIFKKLFIHFMHKTIPSETVFLLPHILCPPVSLALFSLVSDSETSYSHLLGSLDIQVNGLPTATVATLPSLFSVLPSSNSFCAFPTFP